MPAQRQLLIEGLTPDELLALPADDLEQLILTGQPLVFRVGTATVLGQFVVQDKRLTVELAHIEGGGEGALPAIASLAQRYSRQRQLNAIDWFVYATDCSRPNPKLRRVLLSRGFTIQVHPLKGECFYKRHDIDRAS